MAARRVLIVDDMEPVRTLMQRVLERDGYATTGAGDGLQALEAMQEAPADLIISDICMPRMDGYAFFAAVRAHPEWVTIPFIFLTARGEREDLLKGKALGVEDYLIKPFLPEELLVAVRARLQRAQAIRSATQAEFEQLKQQIVDVLGHELRTPLFYITGYTDIALKEVPTLSPESLQESLQAIKLGADRLKRLVEDLLLLVRLDAGQAQEQFESTAKVAPGLLAWLVACAVRRYEEQAAAAGVTLQVEGEPNLPPVRLCEALLEDALGRLIDNALRFSRRETKQVTVSVRRAGRWVEIEVRDTGIGIAAAELPHLFERFRQIGREKMEQQGVGVGLAIARGLVLLHGGDIAVESKLGEGSAFTIRLPVAGGRVLLPATSNSAS